MISEERLREEMKRLLGPYAGDDFPYADVAGALSRFEEDNGMSLSPYGYVMWAVDHHGYKCAYRNLMASQAVTSGYAEAARKFRDDMPALLVNASGYAASVLSNVADFDTCLMQLEGMSFPHVLWVLFAGSGQEDKVRKYRDATREHLRRYPSTLDLLPESYRNVGKELADADAEQH